MGDAVSWNGLFKECKIARKPPVLSYEEPFRLFFPIGALLGLLGVALWPLYYAGVASTHHFARPPHDRRFHGFVHHWLSEYAGPRITSAPHFTRTEVLVLVTLDLFAAGLHFGGSHRAADFLFAFGLAAFAFILGKRFAQRADSPPPNFVLVGLGLLNGVIGALLVAIYQNELYSAPYRIGASLLEQGFVLLPILGVGPYLLARLLNISRADALPESRVLPPGWLPRAAFAVTIGLTIDAIFVTRHSVGQRRPPGCVLARSWFTSRFAHLGVAEASSAIVCAPVWRQL